MVTLVVESTAGAAGRVLSEIRRRNEDIKVVRIDDFSWDGVDGVDAGAAAVGAADARQRSAVAMGASVFRSLTGCETSLNKARGYRYDVSSGIVIPTFSPEDVGRGRMNLMPVLLHDVARAQKERGLPPPQFPLHQLTLFPTPGVFEEWVTNAVMSSFIAHDIETPHSKKNDEDEDELDESYNILRISLADDCYRAITVPYQEPFVATLKWFLFEYDGARVGWNSDEFDDPREEANGWCMKGRREDVRWLWHSLQPTLPQSLGHVSTYYDRVPEWKSIGSDGAEEELYSCMDARQTAVNYVGIKNALKARTIVQ